MSKGKVSKSYETAEKINQELLTSGITIPRMTILIQDTLDEENINLKAEHTKMLECIKNLIIDSEQKLTKAERRTRTATAQALLTEIEGE